jgi:hypothetical protein
MSFVSRNERHKFFKISSHMHRYIFYLICFLSLDLVSYAAGNCINAYVDAHGWVSIMKSDGSTIKISKGYEPSVSPDNRWVVYDQLYSINKDGPSKRCLKIYDVTKGLLSTVKGIPKNSDCYAPVFSPSGQKICFVYIAPPGNSIRKIGGAEIATIDVLGTNFRVLTTEFSDTASQNGFIAPSWIMPGDKILFRNRCNLYVVDLEGKKIIEISLNSIRPSLCDIGETNFSLTNDLHNLLFDDYLGLEDSHSKEFCRIGPDKHIAPGHRIIYKYDLIRGQLGIISPVNMAAFKPQWQEFGRRFTFLGYFEGGKGNNQRELYSIYSSNLEGNDIKKICDAMVPDPKDF